MGPRSRTLVQAQERNQASPEAQITATVARATATPSELHVQQEARHAEDTGRQGFRGQQGVQGVQINY